ncbi:MAG: transposase [Chloroflexi bacterium]|nr:transposase [Chloroflexota bacterium]
MPYRDQVFVEGSYYHLFNRSVDGEKLFFNRETYEYCLRLANLYRRKCGVSVVAYCLMPNHYHFLLKQETGEPLSKFINLLFNSYVQAVNRQQSRKGPLFEERFRHVLVDRNEYLVHLCRYIHLNPAKAGLVSRPEDWPFSDYREWIGQRAKYLGDNGPVQGFFTTAEEYRQFVTDYHEETQNSDKIGRYIWD